MDKEKEYINKLKEDASRVTMLMMQAIQTFGGKDAQYQLNSGGAAPYVAFIGSQVQDVLDEVSWIEGATGMFDSYNRVVANRIGQRISQMYSLIDKGSVNGFNRD